MELLQLRYFCESAQSESFAQTAKKYMVPTTSVSASVKRLEQELNCQLFDRSANRLRLNANGKRLQQSLCLVFSELDGAVCEIANRGDDRQEIRLLVRAVRRWITDSIIAYNKMYPQVAFKTVFDFRETDYKNYDIVIDEESDRYPDCEGIEIYSTWLRLKCSTEDPLCGGNYTLRQLCDHKFISMGEESNMHKILTKSCGRAGFSPNIAIICNDIECYEKLIASGMGIGMGREDASDHDLGVATLDVSDFREKYSVYAYCRKSACFGNIKSFLDYLQRQRG